MLPPRPFHLKGRRGQGVVGSSKEIIIKMNCPNCGKENIKKLYTYGKKGEEKQCCGECKDKRETKK